MRSAAIGAGVLAVVFAGAIFGFFYAWVCSTMWGLDAADPGVAIAAMQAMNASVRNAVFAPAFFGTPFMLALAAALAFLSGARKAALLFLAGAFVYALGGAFLTFRVNVPMNLALAEVTVPHSAEEARAIWTAYSKPWQVWNQIRTGFSAVALVLGACALVLLGAAGSTDRAQTGS